MATFHFALNQDSLGFDARFIEKQSKSFLALRDIQTGERVLLQFRTEVFNLPKYENLLCWACGLNTGNNRSILGALQLDYLTAAPELAKFNPG